MLLSKAIIMVASGLVEFIIIEAAIAQQKVLSTRARDRHALQPGDSRSSLDCEYYSGGRSFAIHFSNEPPVIKIVYQARRIETKLKQNYGQTCTFTRRRVLPRPSKFN